MSTETEEVKLLQDFGSVRSDRIVTTRRPDLIVVDKQDTTTNVINAAVPLDKNAGVKKEEK